MFYNIKSIIFNIFLFLDPNDIICFRLTHKNDHYFTYDCDAKNKINSKLVLFVKNAHSSKNIDKFPNLKCISFADNDSVNINFTNNVNIHTLIVGNDSYFYCTNIPPLLRKIIAGINNRFTLHTLLPESLTHIITKKNTLFINYDYSYVVIPKNVVHVDNVWSNYSLSLCDKLKYISYDDHFNTVPPQLFDKKELETLILGEYYNCYNYNNIPDSVKTLVYGNKYDIEIYRFPDSLVSLTLSSHYSKPLPEIPNTCVEINFRHNTSFGSYTEELRYMLYNYKLVLTLRLKYPHIRVNVSYHPELTKYCSPISFIKKLMNILS